MNTIKKIHFTFILVFIAGFSVKAQLNPLNAQYFINQYLVNPAFAGYTKGLKINGAYRKLWSNVPGSPLTQNVTADYGFNKVGLGLNIYNESAGLQRQTRAVGSFAYHLPLNSDDQQLHFGVSLGFTSQRLENSDINGDPTDPSVGLYNSRKNFVDGDFGVAYADKYLTLQAALPNLKSLFRKEEIKFADAATFYTAVSYKLNLSGSKDEQIDIEPKIAFRGVKGMDNIWDAGAQMTLGDRQILLHGFYHSSKNATFGIGMDFKKKYLIFGSYTTQTSALSNATNGSFELNLRLSLDQ